MKIVVERIKKTPTVLKVISVVVVLSVWSGASGAIEPNKAGEIDAIALSDSRVYLKWADTTSGKSEFAIERKTTPEGEYKQIAINRVGVTRYTDVNLTKLTTYYYRVRAYNAEGNQADFAEVRAVTHRMGNPFELGGFTLQELDVVGGFNDPEIFASLDQLIQTGANSVIIAPQVWMKTKSSNTLEKLNAIPSNQLADIGKVIAYLKNAHINVAVKPNLVCYDNTWSGRIKPENTDIWFESYKNMLLEYALLAEKSGADTLYLTNEMKSMVAEPKYKNKWEDTIKDVRKVFHGSISLNSVITFQDNEVMNISFAEQLDFVGVSLYLNYTNKKHPKLEEIINAWYGNKDSINIVQQLEKIHSMYGKPVMISEIGFRSVEGANTNVSDMESSGAVDFQEQSDLYEAMMEVLTSENKEWLKGVSAWGWFTNLKPSTKFASRECRLGPLFGVQGSVIQNKPAEKLLTAWFSGTRRVTDIRKPGREVHHNARTAPRQQ